MNPVIDLPTKTQEAAPELPFLLLDFRPLDTMTASVKVRSREADQNGRNAVLSRLAKEAVLMYARQQGFNAHGLDNMPPAYPVDDQGQHGVEVLSGAKPIAAWEAVYTVMAKL